MGKKILNSIILSILFGIVAVVIGFFVAGLLQGCDIEDDYTADTDTETDSDIQDNSCAELEAIAGNWYGGESYLPMTVSLYEEDDGLCRVNFSDNASFSGDFFGNTLPLVRVGSCGWIIVTMLDNGNLIQSGYA